MAGEGSKNKTGDGGSPRQCQGSTSWGSCLWSPDHKGQANLSFYSSRTCFQKNQGNNIAKLPPVLWFICSPLWRGPTPGEGWLHMCVTHSRAMQSNIRLSLPQHPYPPGSPKQCQDLSTWQMRAQEHSLAIGLSVTLPNPSMEQRDAGSSYCETLELHCRALSEPGRAAGGCFVISAICLFALPSSAPPGYAHTYLFSKSFAGSQ